MIEEQELENIRKNANIIDIISSYLPLTQKGKNYFGVCPFHEDHSPSMSVSPEKQIYKCFSCGAAGNVFTFIQEYENVSFLEAVKIVAEKSGLSFHGAVNKQIKKKNTKEYEVMDIALKYYQNNLNTKEGEEAKKYLSKRGLNDEVIKDFDIGLSLNNSLNKLLLNKNYDEELLISLGLASKKDEYLNDIFNNRIMFPIHNLEGECVGFTGRIYNNEDTAKYINTKETDIFKKGNLLFNYHRAKTEIKRKKEVIIVEGNMDAIRMYANGIKNVIALMGTSLTTDQINIIKNLKAKVILILDNDSAGEVATYQNGNLLEKNNIPLKIVRLSNEKDPDEYIIKNGIEAMIENINKPISFLDFKLSYLKKDLDLEKAEDLVKYIKSVINEIKDIKDNLTKEVIIKNISSKYDISLDLLKEELEKSTPELSIKPKVIEKKEKSSSKLEKAANIIIYFMINESIYIKKFEQELGYIANKTYRSIINEILYFYEKNKDIDMSSFITFISSKDYIYDDFMRIINNVNLEELKESTFEEAIKSAKSEMKKEEIEKIKKQINEEMDANKKLELLNKLIELKKDV